MNEKIEKLFEEFKKQVIAIINADGKEPEIDKEGTKRWYKMIDGKKVFHRDGDEPSIICANGAKEWYRDGKLHRENDEPAIINSDGPKMWYRDGKLHRDNDKPAIIYTDGTKKWYRDGKLHRDGDKPGIIRADGTKSYYIRGTKVPAP